MDTDQHGFLRSLATHALVAVLLGLPSLGLAAASSFGFSGPESYPLDAQASQLHVADLDGDGLNDLVVVNNAHSKINLLYNQTGKTNGPAGRERPRKRELNELPPGARFRLESISSDKHITSLVVADLNGDGRPDLAYYGEPKELVVLYNLGAGGWSAPHRWPIEDGQLSPNALCPADLNGEGRLGLLLLGESCLYFLPQKADHTLGEPQSIPFAGAVKSVQVADLDGDGRSDLLLVDWEDRYPFRCRLQRPGGQLGPEFYFASPPIRAYCVEALEGAPKAQIVSIAQNSGRAQVSQLVTRPAEPLAACFRQGQFQVLPLQRTDKARRGLLWADVNGDGRPDLLVAEPGRGQISLYLQQPDGSLAAPVTFPTLAGVTDLAAADWDGDGRPSLFLLSEDERQLGVTRLDEHGRLPFPRLLPLPGRPLALAAGALQPGAKPSLAVIVDQNGRRALVIRDRDGKTKTQQLSESFKLNPTTLAFHDVDQDGLVDLVILVPYEKIKVLRQVLGKDFEEIDVAPPGGGLEQPWLSAADIDGDGKPELLLTQKNFVRAVVLKRQPSSADTSNAGGWSLEVKEQINGAASNSRLVGAAALPCPSNSIPALFLLDAERKALTYCERNRAGVWQVARNVPLPVSEFASLQPLALAGHTPNALAFLGLNAVALLPLDGPVWELAELDSYETPIKDGHLSDVVAGDLNRDGRKELLFLETARNYLDLVVFDERHKLVPANRWPVFEERSFRGRQSPFPEPREAVIADVTGDGKADLIVLVHDRILVYPQE